MAAGGNEVSGVMHVMAPETSVVPPMQHSSQASGAHALDTLATTPRLPS